MSKPHIVTAIDIGTSVVKAVQVKEDERAEAPELIGVARVPSDSVRKGVVENIQRVAKIIATALEELRQMSARPIHGVFVNIGGGHIFVVRSKGEIAVSRADHEISQGDVERVLQVAQTFSLPPNREILEVWPQKYIVDHEDGIREPVGMKGMRLGVEVLALCGFSPYVKNVEDAVVHTGAQVFDVIPSPLAAARAVLTRKQKELGCALVDIGARTTDLAVFEEGELVHAITFPVGSANITDDIAVGLRVSAEDAEQIKLRFGLLELSGRKSSASRRARRLSQRGFPKKRRGAQKQIIAGQEALGEGDTYEFSKRELAKIVKARVVDIFDAISKELEGTSLRGRLPGGVVLCGGGAQLPRILEFAKQEFRAPCTIGIPKGIAGVERDPSLAVVCGLALEGLSLTREETFLRSQKAGFFRRIKELLGAFVP